MTEVTIRNNKLVLGADRETYWPEKKTLIISDIHLGKTQHFSTNGIGLPSLVNKNNYWRLSVLLDTYKTERVVFLGDLFHSVYNQEWDKFVDYMQNYPSIEWVLVLGNHDILDPSAYDQAKLLVVDHLLESDMYLTHEPSSHDSGAYNICGHLHPAIRMKAKGTPGLRLPCYYFGTQGGILPAFGEFTGTHTIKPKKGEKVFVIADKEVIQIS